MKRAYLMTWFVFYAFPAFFGFQPPIQRIIWQKKQHGLVIFFFEICHLWVMHKIKVHWKLYKNEHFVNMAERPYHMVILAVAAGSVEWVLLNYFPFRLRKYYNNQVQRFMI